MSDSITSRVVFNVFKGSLLFIGLILFSLAWFMNKDNLEQDKWPVTKGKVFYSKVVVVYDKILGRKVKHFDLDVKYAYVVNNKRYDNKGLFLENTDKNLEKSFFSEQSKIFTKNKVVPVHYNPKNPKESYLVADIDSGTRSFYSASQKIVLFALFLFAITPLITFIKDKSFKRKNKVESGLVVPDDAIRVQPIRKHR